MPKVFNTALEEKVLAWPQNEDLGPLLAEFWNNPEKYKIYGVQEGSLRDGKYNIRGRPLYANKYFRAIALDQCGNWLYEFIRDGSDMVASISVTKETKETQSSGPK